jgi:hypothetical protein
VSHYFNKKEHIILGREDGESEFALASYAPPEGLRVKDVIYERNKEDLKIAHGDGKESDVSTYDKEILGRRYGTPVNNSQKIEQIADEMDQVESCISKTTGILVLIGQ